MEFPLIQLPKKLEAAAAASSRREPHVSINSTSEEVRRSIRKSMRGQRPFPLIQLPKKLEEFAHCR